MFPIEENVFNEIGFSVIFASYSFSFHKNVARAFFIVRIRSRMERRYRKKSNSNSFILLGVYGWLARWFKVWKLKRNVYQIYRYISIKIEPIQLNISVSIQVTNRYVSHSSCLQ